MIWKVGKYLLVFLFLLGCKEGNAQPEAFTSYNEAQQFVNNTDFDIEETANTDGRSTNNWISSAEYKANDKANGFLSMGMKGKQYVFDEVPYSVWEELKNADDMGDYYHDNIKGKYILTLKGNMEADTQCKGITKKGKQCKRTAIEYGYCFQHSD